MPEDVNMSEAERIPTGPEMPSTEAVPGTRPEMPISPEGAAESAREKAHEKYREILTKVSGDTDASPTADTAAEEDIDAKAVYDETDAEARVNKLLSLAETKNPEYAVRVAMKLNDFYVLDRVHDEMAEKFYDALVERGVIRG